MSQREIGILLAILSLATLTQTDPRLIRLFVGNVAAMGLLWLSILIPLLLFHRALATVRAPRPQRERDFSWYLKS
ncbi:MAG: hypothetical protein HY319_21815 [Armatimonadetes bacterium]|nr:hypothetical protein [Armatimonadota bacterium]